jgi:hypothetical protein
MEFPPLPLYPKGRNKEMARRQSYKNNIGAIKPDTLMLDRQLSASGEDEFCDGLFITDKLDYWTHAIDKLLQDEGLCKKSKPVLGGFITTWKMNNETIYVIHTYSSKNKIMIQPGRHKQSNLLSWIPIFTKIRKNIVMHKDESSVLLHHSALSNVYVNAEKQTNDSSQGIRLHTLPTDTIMTEVSDEVDAVKQNDNSRHSIKLSLQTTDSIQEKSLDVDVVDNSSHVTN